METLKIIKIGGKIIDDEMALENFLEGFSKLKSPKILVHGGGALASRLAQKMSVDVKMHNGRRITDKETLDIALMVYSGKINTSVVAKLQALKVNAIGFSGADGNTILSKKRPVKDIDFGYVGDIINVNSSILKTLVNSNITPVFCAITHNGNGQLLNTNADTIASELAIALSKDFQTELYYVFEKNGVLQDVTDEDSVIEHIDSDSYLKLKTDGVIADGMLPKLDNCFHALNHGVDKVCIGKPEMLFSKTAKFTTLQQ